MNLRGILVLLGVLATMHPPAARADEESPPPADVSTIVDGGNRFAIDLYERLRHTPGNIAYSPYSVSTALAMTYAGARGQTAAEMARVLHFSFGGGRLHNGFRTLQAEVNGNAGADSTELTVANRLWGQKGFGFRESFLDTMRADYGADLGEVDFARDVDGAREAINDWAAEKTEGRIPELLEPGILDPAQTVLVLTDAIYFKARWAARFDPNSTIQKPFHLDRQDTVVVPTMIEHGEFSYGQMGGLSALRLEYEGENLSMLILLPDEVEGLPALEDSISSERIGQWIRGMSSRTVDVYLPRFKFTTAFSLGSELKELGMPTAFTKAANFTGMAPAPVPLKIGFVVHKAFVAVGERGTEASAATAVEMRSWGRIKHLNPPPPLYFIADHPFLFLIRDDESGVILFLGRVTNPRSTE